MKRGFVRGQKGLSPVIASVLLILLVIVLAILIFAWARGFISEQVEKFGQPIDSYCEAVSFEAEIVDGQSGDANGALEIVNRGDIDIFRFGISLIKGGNSVMIEFDYPVAKGESIREDFEFSQEGLSYEDPETVELFPVLVGVVKGQEATKPFTCLDNGKEIAFPI